MNIEYVINLEDLVDFNLFYYDHSSRSRKQRSIRRFFYLAVTALLFLFGVFAWLMAASFFGAVICFMGGLFLLAYYLLTTGKMHQRIRQSVIRAYENRRNGIIGKHKLSISPEGITDTTEEGESLTRWTRVESIDISEHYIYFSIIPRGVQFIPERAFSGGNSMKRFFDTARSYHEKSQMPQ